MEEGGDAKVDHLYDVLRQQAQTGSSSSQYAASPFIRTTSNEENGASRRHGDEDVSHEICIRPYSHSRVYAVKTRVGHVTSRFTLNLRSKTDHQIGREMDAVLSAMQYRVGEGSELRGVKSVFCVVNSPGRVYVETDDDALAERIFKDCIFVSHGAEERPIPSREVSSLLSPVPERGMCKNSWVKILGGLYHGDIGQVRGFLQDDSVVQVAIAPRLAPAPTLKRSKRRRKQESRPSPRRITWQDAVTEYGLWTVKTMTEGFELKDLYIENDGFHLLSVNRKAVQVVKPKIHEISMFTDAAVEKVLSEGLPFSACTDDDVCNAGGIDVEKLDVDCLVRVGDSVEITGGRMRGFRGRVSGIVNRQSMTLLINDEKNGKGHLLELQENVQSLRPLFSKGDLVFVRCGIHEGRTGYVEDSYGTQVFVRDHVTLEEVSI